MNDLKFYGKEYKLHDYILKVEDHSGPQIEGLPDYLKNILTKRARVFFKNGLQLSIITGGCSFGGEQGLFEIAVLDETGLVENVLPEGEVAGYLTANEVNCYIEKIGNLPEKQNQS